MVVEIFFSYKHLSEEAIVLSETEAKVVIRRRMMNEGRHAEIEEDAKGTEMIRRKGEMKRGRMVKALKWRVVLKLLVLHQELSKHL